MNFLNYKTAMLAKIKFKYFPHLSAKNLFIVLIKLLMSVFFLWFAFQKVDLNKVSFETVELFPLTLAMLLAFTQILINSARWLLLIEKISEKYNSFKSVFIVYYLSCFLNQVFPSIASDFVRVISSKNLNTTLVEITESVVLERIISLYTLLFVSIAAFPWIYVSEPKIGAALNIIIIFFFMILIIFLILSNLLRHQSDIWIKIPQTLVSFIDSLNWLFTSKKSWSLIIPLSLTVHILSSVMLYLLANAVQADISIYTIFQICPLMLLAQILPISFGGWGTRETVAVILMTQAGLSPSTSITISILFGLVLLFVSTPGLIVWLLHNFASQNNENTFL
jgi:uncharacterized protein (TIRG00374 family)